MKLSRSLNIQLTLTNESRSAYGVDTRLLLRKNSGESMQHVAMKLLSFGLFYHPQLDVERAVGQHYKPDLTRSDDRGHIVQWIECGSTSIRKLDRVTRDNPYAVVKIVKPTGRAARLYRERARLELRRPERVEYLGFEAGFVDRLASRLSSRHDVVFVVTADPMHIYAAVDDESLDSSVLDLEG